MAAKEAPGTPVSFNYVNDPMGGTEVDSKKPGSGDAKGTGKHGNHYGNMDADTATGAMFSSHEIMIPTYSNADTVKPYLAFSMTENNGASTLCDVRAMRWNTSGGAAISRIDIAAATGNNLKQYSSAYLYGLRNS
jgi:hypothetical protein